MGDGGARVLRILAGVEKPPPCQEVSLAGRRRESDEEEVWVCPDCNRSNPHGYSWPDHLHGPDRRSPWEGK